MSIRIYDGKKAKPGETWWIIDIGRGKARQRIPFEGSFVDAENYEKTVRPADVQNVVSARSPIKKLIPEFLPWYKNEVAKTTLEDINDTINIYIIPHFGNLRLEQLTLDMVNRFKVDLLEKGLKPVTINKHLNYFSSFIKWAVNHGKCSKLGFDLPRFPKKKIIREQIRPLTRRQVDAIYTHIQPCYRLAFLLMADHGLRVSEALGLRVEAVDEDNELLNIVGKGNKIRQVPFMSDRFVEQLDITLQSRLEGYLTINEETGLPYVTMWKELQRAAKAAGLKRQVNHHLLRHTCATLCAQAGMNPHALQKVMGHQSIETTNKIYTHVSLDFVGDEGRKIRDAKR